MASAENEELLAETQPHGDGSAVDGCGNVRGDHGFASAHVYAYGSARLVHVNSYVHACDCGRRATGPACSHLRVVWRRVGAGCGSYCVSPPYSRAQIRSLVAARR
jgi:hypothetical protein